VRRRRGVWRGGGGARGAGGASLVSGSFSTSSVSTSRAAKMGLSKPTSTPTMWKVSVLDLCACARHVGLVTGSSARGEGVADTGAVWVW
jgi:hypothetical protein